MASAAVVLVVVVVVTIALSRFMFDFPFKLSLFIKIGTRCVCVICLCLPSRRDGTAAKQHHSPAHPFSPYLLPSPSPSPFSLALCRYFGSIVWFCITHLNVVVVSYFFDLRDF